MNLLLFVFAWSLLDVTKGENCAGSHSTLPDIEKRVSSNTDTCQNSGENCITDASLASDWYDVGNRNMPTDPSGLRTYSSCGTHWPIWLNGTIPKISDGRVNRKACLKTPWSTCDLVYTIADMEVINCGTHMLYKLSPTFNSYFAYCFDPTNLTTDSATVEPGLSFRDQQGVAGQIFKKPGLYFRCQFNGNETDELYYSVSWYVNDLFLMSKGPVLLSNIDNTNLYESELIQSGYKLDINIKCIINSSKSREGSSGNSTTSLPYWLGIRVLNPAVGMVQGRSTTIQLQPTFPFGCSSKANDRNPKAKCLLSVHMFDPDDSNDCKSSSISVKGNQKCGVQISGFYYYEWTTGVRYDNVTEMTITTRDPNDYHQGRNTFTLKLLTGGTGLNDIVQGSYISNIIVTTSFETAWQAKTCYSYVDPHMRSFDGRYYENQNVGIFVMYRHRSSKQEVQMKTKRCNSFATCACAVVVRAGGDIFLIDLCRSPVLINHVSCKENILNVRKINAYSYKIYMPLGTVVSVAINNWPGYESTLNLNIYPSVKDINETRGLCGALNNDQSDDFMTPSGHIESDNDAFSLAWSIGHTKSLFNQQNHDPDEWDEDAQFCVCPAALKSGVYESEFDPLCSADQSSSCNKKDDFHGKPYQTCSIRAKRSKQSMSKEIDRILRREVLDNDIKTRNVVKRSILNITFEEALEACANFFASNCTTSSFEDRLPNSNTNSKNSSIANCALDYTYTGDMSLASLHCETYRSEVDEEISRNSTFREANPDVVESFRAIACINNCNNHGDCVNGLCICYAAYIEDDCSVSLSNYPAVEDTYAGGLCQKDKDDCCGEVPIYGSRFVNGTTKQKVERFQIHINGTNATEEQIIQDLSILNPFEATMIVPCHTRNQRSTDSDNSSIPFISGTRVSLTNDGTNYGSAKFYYILDSRCQGVLNDTDGYKFYLLDGTCFISGTCYSEGEHDSLSGCHRCQPANDRFYWTYGLSADFRPVQLKEVELSFLNGTLLILMTEDISLSETFVVVEGHIEKNYKTIIYLNRQEIKMKCTSSKTDPPILVISVCVGLFVIVLLIAAVIIMKCCFKKEKRIAAHSENGVTGHTPVWKILNVAAYQSTKPERQWD